MIYEYGFKNFFSFKEGMNLSFRLDAKCPEDISLGRDFTPVLCIKGANSSGKTHVLRALSFLASFCTGSFNNKPDSQISVTPFFDSNDPTEFFVEFKLGSEAFRYELVVTPDAVIRETIFRTIKKRVKILERADNRFQLLTKPWSRLESIKLRKNASVISTAHQYELDELEPVYKFFSEILTNVGYTGIRDPIRSTSAIAGFLQTDSEFFGFVKNFIMSCDVGIKDISIGEREQATSDSKEKEPQKEYFPIYTHFTEDKDHHVAQETESSGTRALFRSLALYKLTLERGGILALDEFDIHLHPHILPKLLNLFLDPKINKNNAQLIISTHDAEVLNLLGRYRTYLINKVDNESFGYRLDEIPGDVLRNDRPILPAYNEGRIGGVPVL